MLVIWWWLALLYGAGTCRLYSRKSKELTNKLMMLENFVISYTSVTKKLHSISIEEVKRCRRKYRNYNGIIKLVLLKVWKEGFVILKILELCMSIHYTETRVNFWNWYTWRYGKKGFTTLKTLELNMSSHSMYIILYSNLAVYIMCCFYSQC